MYDLWLTHEGDLQVGADGDLALAEGVDCGLQSAALRLKCEPGDMVLHVDVGTGLADLIGETLSLETVARGEAAIIWSLQQAEALEDYRVSVKGAPISKEEVVFVISLFSQDGQRVAALAVPFDYHYGINLAGLRAIGSERLVSIR